MGPWRILLFAIFLASCALPPTQEFNSYTAAFDQAHAQTTQMLEFYNDVEKSVDFQDEDANRLIPDRAYLFVKAGEAPRTKALRRGFELIHDYNVILARYVAGDSVSVLSNDIAALNSSATRLGDAIGSSALGSSVGAILTAAKSLARLSLASADTEEFRRSLNTSAPLIREFLSKAREQSETMFSEARTRARTRILEGEKPQTVIERREAFKTMVASWVLMIDETQEALDLLTEAAQYNRPPRSVLARLAASTDRLALYAEELGAVRRSLDGLF